MGFAKDTLGIFMAVLAIVMGHEAPGETGAQKKAAALAKIKEILAAPGGIDFPKILVPIEDWLLSLFIDMAVLLLNKTGFFVQGASSNKPSPT